MPKLCNSCRFLSIGESEQRLIKTYSGEFFPHICKKYNKRVTHFPYSEPFIHPCEECENGIKPEKTLIYRPSRCCGKTSILNDYIKEHPNEEILVVRRRDFPKTDIPMPTITEQINSFKERYIEMTMNDLCRKINCKHITWSNGGGDSCTAWLECKLHKELTDETYCAKCKERVPKRSKGNDD